MNRFLALPQDAPNHAIPPLNEAPRSSLLRRSSHFGYEGRKLRGILRNSPKPLPSFAKATEGSPRLAYSAEAAASAAKAGHPRSSLLRRSSYFSYKGRKLRGIRRRRIISHDTTHAFAVNSYPALRETTIPRIESLSDLEQIVHAV